MIAGSGTNWLLLSSGFRKKKKPRNDFCSHSFLSHRLMLMIHKTADHSGGLQVQSAYTAAAIIVRRVVGWLVGSKSIRWITTKLSFVVSKKRFLKSSSSSASLFWSWNKLRELASASLLLAAALPLSLDQLPPWFGQSSLGQFTFNHILISDNFLSNTGLEEKSVSNCFLQWL